jgi:glutathione S-transferase
MPIVIHGAPISPFVRKVRIALAEKGIEHELRSAIPRSEALLRLNPLGKIPTLEEDGFAIGDSSVICDYLEQTRPDPALYPADTRERARALFLEEYADSRLSEVVGAVPRMKLMAPLMGQPKADQATVDKHVAEIFPTALDWLESHAPASGDAFVGARFGIAEIAIAAQLRGLVHAGEEVSRQRWPRLRAWLDRVSTRPSVQGTLAAELEAFEQLGIRR